MLKTLRDIRETIGSFISILVVIFIGCFFFAGIAEASTAVSNKIDDYCAAQHIASARATYMYVNSAAVDEIAASKGVKKAAGYDTFYTKLKGTRVDVTITTLTDGIDEPTMIRGKLPKAGEIIVDSKYVESHTVRVGDVLTFDIDELDRITLTTDGYNASYTPKEYTFTVSGIFHSPDVIRKVNMMNTADPVDAFIMAYVNYGEIKSYSEYATVDMGVMQDNVFKRADDAGVKIYNGVKILGEPKDGQKLFEKYTVTADNMAAMLANPQQAAGMFLYALEKDEYPSIVGYTGINDTIKALAAVLPLIFFAVAAAITVISLSKTVDNQRMQIGVIQALGISKGSVYFSYIFYALFACLVGGFSGGIVGTIAVPPLLELIYKRQFAMPPTPLHAGVLYMFLGVIISAALACLAAFLSCHRTLKAAPAQAMRPKPPKKTKRILAERWTGLWNRLGFGAKMNLRNMFLHKMRMLLSSVGIIGCLALLIGLVGLKDNMAFSFDHYEKQSGYDIAAYSAAPVDITAAESYESLSVDGVQKLTFVPAFSAHFTFNGNSSDQTLMALPTASDKEKYRRVDPDCVKLYYDMSQKNRIKFGDGTFVIPESLAKDLGAEKGDTVTVSGRTLTGETKEFTAKITAVVAEYFEQKAYCSYGFFENAGIAMYADTAYISVKGAAMSDVVKTLEDVDGVRAVQTFRAGFEVLADRMSLLDYAVLLFVVGAGALAVAVIYNITATNLKERTREIATLMVLGYKKRETANMLLVENMVITGIGCLLGLPFGYWLLYWLGGLTESFSVIIASFMSWYTALGCIGLTFVFSFIATMFLNRKMKKISMVEALKSVE